MALTLLEASKINDGEVIRSAVIEMFAANSDILRVLPFEDIPGGSLNYMEEGKLPNVAFRGYNESFATSTGLINPGQEVLRILGGDLDVDIAMIKTRGEQVRSIQEAMKIKALALNITKVVVKGDSTLAPREFDGLQARLTGSQLVPANLTAPAANSPLSLEALSAAIDAVDGPTHLLMSKGMRNKLTTAARNINVGGDLQWTKDEFGRRIAVFNDLPILIADYDETGARILDFNEAGPAGGVVSQSIYILSIGSGSVQGIQNGTMEVRDLGELETSPKMRTRVEWLASMAVMHSRAAARVWGITNAAVTA